MNESMNSELQSQCDKLHAIESCCSSPTILTWRKQNCHIMFIWTSENVKIFPNWYYVRRIHFHSDTLEDISILYNFPIICVDRNSQNVRINKQYDRNRHKQFVYGNSLMNHQHVINQWWPTSSCYVCCVYTIMLTGLIPTYVWYELR